MVQSGAMVSLIQPGITVAQVNPCDVQARCNWHAVGYTRWKSFNLRNKGDHFTFVLIFVVSHLKRYSWFFAWISCNKWGWNQSSGPITLHKPLFLSVEMSRAGGFGDSGPDHRWANGIVPRPWGRDSRACGRFGRNRRARGDWQYSHSLRIVRFRVIRRSESAVVKVPGRRKC